MKRKMLDLLKELHADDRAAIATEYVLILTLVVFPMALAVPMLLETIKVYGYRVIEIVRIPFP